MWGYVVIWRQKQHKNKFMFTKSKEDKRMQNEYEIKKEMCEIGRRVYNRGMVAANDGNFSVK